MGWPLKASLQETKGEGTEALGLCLMGFKPLGGMNRSAKLENLPSPCLSTLYHHLDELCGRCHVHLYSGTFKKYIFDKRCLQPPVQG